MLKVHPALAIRYINHQAGAFRLWAIARHADADGCGHIGIETLQACMSGKSLRTFRRWLKQAKRCGLLWQAGDRVYYASLLRAAKLAGAASVGKPVLVDLDEFLGAGWKALIWEAFLTSTTNPNRPISRKVLEDLSGVPQRTQRFYEKVRNVRKRQQYAIGQWDQDVMVSYPLPNIYYPRLAKAPGGKSRKINRTLRYLVNKEVPGPGRLFYGNARGAQRALVAYSLSETYSHTRGRWWRLHEDKTYHQ